MLQDRLNSLKSKHQKLDEQIAKGYSNYLDDSSLKKLKQEKLFIKDQIEKITKQGCRVYSQVNEIPKTIGGLGTTILSTSKGVMTDADARSQNIGGEVLISVF